MPVDGVVAEVGLATDEPFRKRRPRVVEHLAERLVPVDALGFRVPETFAIKDRAAEKFPVKAHPFNSPTMRPVTLAVMKAADTLGKSAKGIVFPISLLPAR